MENEIPIVPLELSEDTKAFFKLFDWINEQRDKWLLSAGIPESQQGQPEDPTKSRLLNHYK